MRNGKCFAFKVPEGAITYANELVDYSIEHHTVPNIFDNSNPDTYGLSGDARSKEYRFVGTLGEVLFADVYGLERPKRSFGADDGQDYGRDFSVLVDNQLRNIDIKTMHRNGNYIYDSYVLNLTKDQLFKENSLTDYYFHITLVFDKNGDKSDITAYFIGHISKTDAIKYGEFFQAGSKRTNNQGRTFTFNFDTYEVMLGDFETVPNPVNEQLPGFHYLTMRKTQEYKDRRKRLDEENR